LGIAV
jgi:hypothetical protein